MRCWRTWRCSSATSTAWPTPASGSTSARSAAARWRARRLPLDRTRTAELLGFAAVTRNSIDATSDRDFLAELCFACAMLARAPVALGGGLDHLLHHGVRLPRAARRLLHLQLDDAAEEERRHAGADPRQGCHGRRPARRACSRCSRACRWRTTATSRTTSGSPSPRSATMRQALAVAAGHRRHGAGSAQRASPPGWTTGFLDATALAEYLVGQGRAVPQAHHGSSAGWWPGPRPSAQDAGRAAAGADSAGLPRRSAPDVCRLPRRRQRRRPLPPAGAGGAAQLDEQLRNWKRTLEPSSQLATASPPAGPLPAKE